MATGNEPEYTIASILKATDYALTIFEDEEKAAIELFDRKGKPYLRDFVDISDAHVRSWISEHARILAVVGAACEYL